MFIKCAPKQYTTKLSIWANPPQLCDPSLTNIWASLTVEQKQILPLACHPVNSTKTPYCFLPTVTILSTKHESYKVHDRTWPCSWKKPGGPITCYMIIKIHSFFICRLKLAMPDSNSSLNHKLIMLDQSLGHDASHDKPRLRENMISYDQSWSSMSKLDQR